MTTRPIQGVMCHTRVRTVLQASYGKCHRFVSPMVLVLLMAPAFGVSAPTRSSVKLLLEDTSGPTTEDWEIISPRAVPPVTLEAKTHHVRKNLSSSEWSLTKLGALLDDLKKLVVGGQGLSGQNEDAVSPGVAAFSNPFRGDDGRPLLLPDKYYERPSDENVESLLRSYVQIQGNQDPIREAHVDSVEDAVAEALEGR